MGDEDAVEELFKQDPLQEGLVGVCAIDFLDGGNSNIFYVHLYLGKIPILPNIFQGGWFNHQLVSLSWGSEKSSESLEHPNLSGGFCCLETALWNGG